MVINPGKTKYFIVAIVIRMKKCNLLLVSYETNTIGFTVTEQALRFRPKLQVSG